MGGVDLRFNSPQSDSSLHYLVLTQLNRTLFLTMLYFWMTYCTLLYTVIRLYHTTY